MSEITRAEALLARVDKRLCLDGAEVEFISKTLAELRRDNARLLDDVSLLKKWATDKAEGTTKYSAGEMARLEALLQVNP